MLPGLRFLFAASILSVSLLVFGMGAIALLRASHQQVANLSAQPAPEPVFAQTPETIPSLSALRAEPAAIEVAPIATDAGRLAALTTALRGSDAEAFPASQEVGASAEEPSTTKPSGPVSDADVVSEKVQPQAAPPEATAGIEPRSQPVAAAVDLAASTTENVKNRGGGPAIESRRAANTPLPRARARAAHRVAAAPHRAAAKRKFAVAKKSRKIQRRYARRKRVRLAPESPNPLSALFGISSGN